MIFALIFSGWLMASGFAADQSAELREAADTLRMEQPEISLRVDEMRPIKNRAGAWFFPGADLAKPAAQLLIQDRILSRDDEASVRVALVYALDSEHRFSWSIIESEEADVRAAMLHGYKGLNTPTSAVVLSRALQDSSADVRAEAARLAGYRSDLTDLKPHLMSGLRDESADVRQLAVRSLGWLGVADAFGPVSTLLQDPEPNVRIAAVRALGKMDLPKARALPELKALATDTEPAVQRAVRRVVQP